MKYKNPVIRGFYPDPSVCKAGDKFYIACSSFQYFPGVPILESSDLINWKTVGHALTRKSQIDLSTVPASGGVFAPTLRYNNGRFYMITNNNTANKNFYVYTDDIYGEWSEPIFVEQDGIDPSLYFEAGEDGTAYLQTNGSYMGESGIFQSKINIATGEIISDRKLLWKGTGGRYIESPHVYKIDGYYYLMVAEGGTEYGHMITIARSENIWGPFESCPHNPILTNRDKAPFIIQGIGHGDLIQDNCGNYHMISLGFRQVGLWKMYHHLGREVFLTPVTFESGWPNCGYDGTTDFEYEIAIGERVCCIDASACLSNEIDKHDSTIKTIYDEQISELTFANTDFTKDWICLRDRNNDNYHLSEDTLIIKGNGENHSSISSPSFIALRQTDFDMGVSCHVGYDVLSGMVREMSDQKKSLDNTSGLELLNDNRVDEICASCGISVYMCETEHYDLLIREKAKQDIGKYDESVRDNDMCKYETVVRDNETCKYEAVVQFTIGGIVNDYKVVSLQEDNCDFAIREIDDMYYFYINGNLIAHINCKFLSCEISSPFTGVVIGLFATGNAIGEFSGFSLKTV